MWLNFKLWIKNYDFNWGFKLSVALPIILVLIVIDWVTKSVISSRMAQNEVKEFIHGFLGFNFQINPGSAYNANADNVGLAISLAMIITLLLIVFLVFINDKKWVIVISLILSGSLANLLARFWAPVVIGGQWDGSKYGVIDFLHWEFGLFGSSNYVFNLADAWVNIGVVTMAFTFIIDIIIICIKNFKWGRWSNQNRSKNFEKYRVNEEEININNYEEEKESRFYMGEKSKYVATEKAERIDKLLTELLKDSFDFSRSMIQKIIEKGGVVLNDVVVESQKISVEKGDVIIVTIPEPEVTEMKAEKIEFDIVYEDTDILIINKPNNIVVHPGAGNASGTLVNGLLEAIDDLSSIGGVERPGIVHRLDKQTTGLLIVAKNDKSHREMSAMIANHDVYKEYTALVWGVITPSKGIVDAPIGRHNSDRKKMMVTTKNSKYAKTNFEVIETFENADVSLIKCNIETGRTHQIRVHFNFIKHPILNDPVYGRLADKSTDFGQYLHASKLVFNHPITGERMEFEAPLPIEFNDKIKELRGE